MKFIGFFRSFCSFFYTCSVEFGAIFFLLSRFFSTDIPQRSANFFVSFSSLLPFTVFAAAHSSAHAHHNFNFATTKNVLPVVFGLFGWLSIFGLSFFIISPNSFFCLSPLLSILLFLPASPHTYVCTHTHTSAVVYIHRFSFLCVCIHFPIYFFPLHLDLESQV